MTGSRGVNEVVGFVLVFSLVVSMVGIVYASGFSGINNVQENERITNAERAFDVLADNIEDMYREDAPSRSTEMKLSDADLEIRESSAISVKVSNATATTSFSKTIDPIVYSSGGDTEIVYEAGAVIRTDGSSSIMKSTPPFVFLKDGGTRRAVVPIVQTRSTGSSSIGGSTTVLIRGEKSVSQTLDVRDDPTETYDVNITFTTASTRASLWESYFDEQITWDDSCSTKADGETVQCTFTVDELYLTWTGIDVQIEN